MDSWIKRGLFKKGVALVCGKISGIAGIDIDNKEIITEKGIKLEEMISQRYWVEETARGYHILARMTEHIPRWEKIGDFEFLGEKRLCIVTPSKDKHFLHANTPADMHDLIIDNHLYEKFSEFAGKKDKTKKPTITEIKKGVSAGERNNTAFKLACDYFRKGLTIDEVNQLILEWNKSCDPPCTGDDYTKLLTTIKSAHKQPNSTNQHNLPNPPNTPNLIGDKDRFNLFLNKKKRPWQSIGRGIHNDHMYLASYIEDEDDRQWDIVITDDKRVYKNDQRKENQTFIGRNEIKKDYGLHYREPFYHELLDTCWSNESIKKFLYTDYKVDLLDLYARIVAINKLFMIYENDDTNRMIALDILRSYFFILFDANSRNFLEAEKGSGKTNQLMIYRALMFNPIGSPDASSASMYRNIESTSGTILVDDFEGLDVDEKNRQTRHIKVNYKRFKSIRSDGRNFRPQAYNAYGHCALNNIEGLDETTLDRCIRFRLIRRSDATDLTVDYQDRRFKPIRDDCYISLLQHWQQVKFNYDNLKVDGLTARNLELFKPLLTIANTISSDEYNMALRWAKNYVYQENITELEDDWEFQLIQTLWEKVKDEDDKTEVEVVVKDITNEIIDKYHYLDSDETKRKKIFAMRSKFGALLKSWQFKKTRPQNIVHYQIFKERILKIIEAKGWLGQLGGLGRLSQNQLELGVQKDLTDIEKNPIQNMENDPSQQEKLQDIRQIIIENPDDNHEYLTGKYGDEFIQQCIDRNILYEAICGKKLEFIGG